MIERVTDGEERSEAPEEKSADRHKAGVRQEDHRARLRFRRHAVAEADAGIRLPAARSASTRRRSGRSATASPTRAGRRPAHHLHAPASTRRRRRRASASTAPTWSRRAATSSCSPASRTGSTRSASTCKHARREPRRRAAPLPRLVGPHRDHRGHVDLQALPQRVRVGILVRRLRPALPQARHHRHRQDAVPVPHQQGRRGPRREHQPAHARGASGRSRSPT